MTTAPVRMPASTAHAIRSALDMVAAARTAAAHTLALALIEAAGGHGSIHPATPHGPTPALCTVTLGRHTVRITGHGETLRAAASLHGLTTEQYDAIRRLLTQDCPHDEACECLEEPWPSLGELGTVGPPDETEVFHCDGTERGGALIAFGRIALTLDDEPVHSLYEALHLTRTTTPGMGATAALHADSRPGQGG